MGAVAGPPPVGDTLVGNPPGPFRVETIWNDIGMIPYRFHADRGTHVSESPEAGHPRPLKPVWFHILLALADGARHGYAIRAEVERRTDGATKLWPATLYGSIRALSERDLIEALEGDADPDPDQRRRYYRLTQAGREALRSEADRLQALVDAVRASGSPRRA